MLLVSLGNLYTYDNLNERFQTHLALFAFGQTAKLSPKA
jgi:hypothetical protein